MDAEWREMTDAELRAFERECADRERERLERIARRELLEAQNGWLRWDQLSEGSRRLIRMQWSGELERLWWRFDAGNAIHA